MKILLNKCKWKVQGYWPYVPVLGKGSELGNELLGVTDWIDATVPGGVHNDLYEAGYIEDPYRELNSLKCEWVENRWWMYKTAFNLDKIHNDKRLTLFFKGIDYKANIYLNNMYLGKHEGMFEEICFDVSEKVKFHEENYLNVLIEHAPDEMHQIGCTSMTKTQKSRFSYKWDFSTRLVNLGIWDDVFIKSTEKIEIEDTSIFTEIREQKGIIDISTQIISYCEGAYRVKMGIYDGETIIQSWEREYNKEKNSINKRFVVNSPKLWYPNKSGKQPLYKLIIEVFVNNKFSDKQEYDIGIRKIRYKKNYKSTPDSLPYTVIINDKPIYIKGVNLVPFDMMYGNVTHNTYERFIEMIAQANINLVRVWGGGIVEKEYFYKLCDTYGIMVWQEFIQSSSGIDNLPSMEPEFLKLLEKSSINTLKQKRNHVCLSVLSGGNELTDEKGNPVNYDNPNIKLLKRIVNKYTKNILFLPSSASGPNEFLDVSQPGKNHDVHGGWKYEGIRNHYEKYNKSDSLLHSEFGVDGCNNLESLKKFLSIENLKVTNMKDNIVWRHHGEWWDTYERDFDIFGEFDSLTQFIKASQFIQAEGLRYILEANRRRKFNNSGSIVWHFNDPWPNVSSTCLVDYYKRAKMGYFWLKKSYSPIHVSLSYNKLYYLDDEYFKSEIFVHNSLEKKNVVVEYEILDSSGDVYSSDKFYKTLEENSCIKVEEINIQLPAFKHKIFFVRLNISSDSDVQDNSVENLYVFSQKEKHIFKNLFDINSGELEVFETKTGYKIKNAGDEVCLFIHLIDLNRKNPGIISNQYKSLFPGEECFMEAVPPILNSKLETTREKLFSLEYFSKNEKLELTKKEKYELI